MTLLALKINIIELELGAAEWIQMFFGGIFPDEGGKSQSGLNMKSKEKNTHVCPFLVIFNKKSIDAVVYMSPSIAYNY